MDKLYLAPAGPPPRPETVSAVQDGADLDATFGSLAVVIDLKTVSRLKLDLTANTLTLEYRPATRGSGVIGRAPRLDVVIACADHATADELYTKLWRRLGDRFDLKRHGAAGSVRSPVTLMAAALAVTAVLSLLAVVTADLTDPPAVLAPFAALDWRAMCGIGGAVFAGGQVWLYRRLTQPPTALELIARR